MTAQCISPIQGTLFRMIQLDECGIPVSGAGSLIVSAGFVQVAVSPQYRDGTTYELPNAQGDLCVNRQGSDKFLRDQVEIQLCSIDPDAVVISTGQELITTGAPATGTGFWVKEGPIVANWGMEVWQADGGDECEGGEPRSAYWAWPHLSAGRLMDFTISDATFEWRIQARSRKANPLWGDGPGAVAFVNQVPDDAHRGFNITNLPLPEETGCGAVTLTL